MLSEHRDLELVHKQVQLGKELKEEERKAYINPAQTDSSIVRTVLARFMAYFEHEVREAFLYKGKRIYGPHIDVEALLEIADRLEG